MHVDKVLYTKVLIHRPFISFWFWPKSLRLYEGFKQNMRRKNSHTIHSPIVCFWSYVSLNGIQNVRVERENGSCSWESKCKRKSYWKSRVYIVKPFHVIGSKHTVYFVQDKIKGADLVESINHVTFLTNQLVY